MYVEIWAISIGFGNSVICETREYQNITRRSLFLYREIYFKILTINSKN